ncbi:MAG: hypothetical protein K0Q49_1527 [Haloplasmataceae bacterium]|jgi:hypothetical protein|nr:hypothetical protein [Haloplasmataceae bacterium]
MKSIILKATVIITLIVCTFFVLNGEPHNNSNGDYVLNHPLTGVTNLKNNFVTKMSNKVENYDIEILPRFVNVANNEYLELYLEEDTLAIAVRNRSNGYVWYSYDVNNDFTGYSNVKINNIKSAVTITTMNMFTTNKSTTLDKNVEESIERIENGFRATVDMTAYQIRFDFIVTLEDNELVIDIPRDSIHEYNPDLWSSSKEGISLTEIDIYPYLGSTKGEENGYIVIPDGIGGIVKLDDTPRTKMSYLQYVQGRDIGDTNINEIPTYQVQDVKPLERITLPIYGIIPDVGNNGILVVSEEGSNDANYNYKVKGLETDYYQSFFTYVYRKTYTQFQSRKTTDNILAIPKEPLDVNVKQRVIFLTGDKASYVGLAKTYREFLERTKNLDNIITPQDEYTTRIELIGNEVTKSIFNEKNVTGTTYNDAIQLLQTLKGDGYINLDVSLKTFNISQSAYRINILRSLGGEKDFKNLLKYTKDNNIDFSYFIDYVYNFGNTKDTAKKMNSQPLGIANLSYMYELKYINKAGTIPINVKKDLDILNKYDINEVSLPGFESILHTTNENRLIHSSIENVKDVEETLQILNDNDKNVGAYNPDFYLYPYINKYLDAPITSSELAFVDATIPLIPLILTGHTEFFSPYLNFIQNEEQSLLRLVEYGINPAYIMTSENTYELQYTNSSDIFISQYDSLKVRMSRYDSVIREGLNAINGQELVDHVFITDGVTKSVFSNGVSIIVNYTNNDITYEDKQIKANGYGII